MTPIRNLLGDDGPESVEEIIQQQEEEERRTRIPIIECPHDNTLDIYRKSVLTNKA